MASGCAYVAQLEEACRLVAAGAGRTEWGLAYQSRSGAPHQPWLEPDILDQLRGLRDAGATDVVVAPIGFVSDHMEVRYDLDLEARGRAEELGLNLVRAGTAGAPPRFVSMVRELVEGRGRGGPQRAPLRTLGPLPPRSPPDPCAPVSGAPAPRPGRRASRG